MCDIETDQPAIGGSKSGGREELPAPPLWIQTFHYFMHFFDILAKLYMFSPPPLLPRVCAFLRKILDPPLVWSMATVVLPRSIFVLMHCSNLYFQNILNKFQTILSTIPRTALKINRCGHTLFRQLRIKGEDVCRR